MKAVPCIWPVDCRWSVVLPRSKKPAGWLIVFFVDGLKVNGVFVVVVVVVVFDFLFVVAVVLAWAQMPCLGLGPHLSEYF